jgi:hypothetical protein
MQKIFRQLLAVDGPMTAFLLATRADVARIHRHSIGSSNSNMGTLSVVVIATKTVLTNVAFIVISIAIATDATSRATGAAAIVALSSRALR